MKRIALITSIALAATSAALAQSDEEILEALRISVVGTFLEQIEQMLPDSFHHSGLAPSDKDQLVQQLATDYAACFEDAVVEYAALTDTPLSTLVSSDGSIGFEGDSGTDFEQLLVPCLDVARQAAGIVD